MVDEESIKNSFSKAKEDIDFLKKELYETREKIVEICDVLRELSEKFIEFQSKGNPTQKGDGPTSSICASTDNVSFKPLNSQNMPISTGNDGVSTDRQTDRQTDRHIENSPKTKENSMEEALEILNSLDNIKKEIRLKFKRLTDQEMLIFSSLYQLEEEKGFADYKSLSNALNLTESSIRDYVSRLIKKDIPVDKKKINNKSIQLSISKNLRKIAPLQTILQLRDL